MRLNNRGFTLVELATVLFIMGVLVIGAIGIARPLFETANTIATEQKLENISKAIDYYARENYRLPCPAVPNQSAANPPFGFELGSGATGNVIPTSCGGSIAGWEGIVPFKTLNIPADWARDAAGHYITYAVSPAFALDTSNPAMLVHRRCRTADWFAANLIYELKTKDPATGDPAASLVTPKNARKARFCCSGADLGTDLLVLDGNNQPQMAWPRQTAAASYATADVTYPNPMQPNVQVPADDRSSTYAYILVSHGSNGFGAYTGQGAGARISLAGATPAESENADGDRTFYEIPKIDRAGTERNFDDVVLWRTQDSVFTSAAESCSLP